MEGGVCEDEADEAAVVEGGAEAEEEEAEEFASGSMTRSWTIGGGSMGRRSAGGDTYEISNCLVWGKGTFAADTTHASLFRLLTDDQFVYPSMIGSVCGKY